MTGLGDPDGRLNVGLLWAASEWDPSRSLPLEALQPLLALQGIRWFSLQQGPAAEAVADSQWPVEPLDRRTAKVEAAAAAMLALDLVIAVDGMPAHLAASLGRPTWLLLKHHADWRWGDREDTPWYRTMRLFRQPAPGDWDGVVRRLRLALQEPMPTVSCGSRLPSAPRGMASMP
jgi:predicted TIM-barrel fold metal-dependent hydrolase